ncbi:MAG: hypothetical protein ACXVD0_03140 [Nocardioides sp.]
MPVEPRPPFAHPARPGLVGPVRVDPSGVRGPTPRQARGPRWRRTSHGLYVPSEVDGSVPEQRIVEAAAALPAYGGVTGWAAMRWWGARWFDGMDGDVMLPVELATMRHSARDQPGIAYTTERLTPRDLVTHDGLRVTSPARTVCFLMRYARSLWRAVQLFELAAFDDVVSAEEVWDYALEHPGWTGIPRCRQAMLLVDENVWSPMETWLRLVWQLVACLSRPRCNQPVFDRQGRHLGTPDLLDVELGIAGEYDGEVHLGAGHRRRDLAREEAYRDAGLECVVVTSADLVSLDGLVRRLHAARRRAARRTGERAWTIDPPAWWVPTQTVAQRRALDARQRAVWLRHRMA